MILEGLESDARAQYVSAGVAVALGAEGLEDYDPEQVRDRLNERLVAPAEAVDSRPAGVSDEDWQLRVALGVAGGRKAG